MNEIWREVHCSVCGGPFEDIDDWFARHSDTDGEDCHEGCCPICTPTINLPAAGFLVEPEDPPEERPFLGEEN